MSLPTTMPDAAALEKVLIGGDLSALSTAQRVQYYNAVCESVGLNPLTKPFDYITLNGKLVLYAKRDCTDQLRKIHSVSVVITSREKQGDVFIVTARATLPSGRTDESIGAVSIGRLSGDALGNAYMKAETKAKRRVTLSICGLGLLDETEVDSIPSAQPPKEQRPVASAQPPAAVIDSEPAEASLPSPQKPDWRESRALDLGYANAKEHARMVFEFENDAKGFGLVEWAMERYAENGKKNGWGFQKADLQLLHEALRKAGDSGERFKKTGPAKGPPEFAAPQGVIDDVPF